MSLAQGDQDTRLPDIDGFLSQAREQSNMLPTKRLRLEEFPEVLSGLQGFQSIDSCFDSIFPAPNVSGEDNNRSSTRDNSNENNNKNYMNRDDESINHAAPHEYSECVGSTVLHNSTSSPERLIGPTDPLWPTLDCATTWPSQTTILPGSNPNYILQNQQLPRNGTSPTCFNSLSQNETAFQFSASTPCDMTGIQPGLTSPIFPGPEDKIVKESNLVPHSRAATVWNTGNHLSQARVSFAATYAHLAEIEIHHKLECQAFELEMARISLEQQKRSKAQG